MTDPTLVKLRELLLNEFTEPELASLCAELGLNYETLPGTGAFGKTRGLIETAKAQDKLRALQSRLRELRPEAYAAAGMAAIAAETASPPIQRTTPTASRTAPANRQGSAFPFQILAGVLVLLLCGVVGLALMLPRLNATVAPGSDASVANQASVPTVSASNPTQPPQGVQPAETTPSTGNVLAPLETITPAIEMPITAATEVAPSTQATGLLTATAAATPESAPTALPVVVLTQTQPAEAQSPAPAISPAAAVTDSNPIVLVIRDLNEQLPAFYKGQATAEDLQQHWSGDALRSVIGFGATRLPRAMRIQPAQRDALNVSYDYQRPPVIASATDTGAVVTSRETWRYANTLNETEICELRDYVYNLVKDGDAWKVRQFRSNLLESGCVPQ
jgi:hypothetical protein